jgi:hypothetical protein
VKELRGAASGTVDAPLGEAFALLAALEDYPRWHPDVVKHVEVLERGDDGQPRRARTALHVAYGPLVRDFNLVMAVTVEPERLVGLKRIPHGSDDPEEFAVTWRLEEPAGTRITLELLASLSVPRLLPVGGIGDSFARGFVDAAARELGG